MTACDHLVKGRVCSIASRIAGVDCRVSREQCEYCTRQADPPQDVNRVTVSLAIKHSPNRARVLASHGFIIEQSIAKDVRAKGASSVSLPIVEGCRFAVAGQCQVSSLIAEVPVPLHPSTCHACKLQDSPMAVNTITCSAARLAVVKAGRDVDPDLQRCLAPKQTGIGTELESIIHAWQHRLGWIGLGWLLEKSASCGCESMKLELNSISIIESRKYSGDLARWIHANWEKRFPKMKPIAPLTRLAAAYALRSAIDSYEAKFKQRRSCDGGR